jgi:hypothetical protein
MKNKLNLKLSIKYLLITFQLFIVIIIYYYIFKTLIPHEIFLDSIDYVTLQFQQYMVEQAAYQQDLINDLTEVFSLETIEEMEEDILSYIEAEDSDIEYNKESGSNDDSNNSNNSETSNSFLPLLLMIHKKLLTKLNKFKTKWNKIINTPITFDKVKIGKQNINLKIIIIFLLSLMLITINPLLMFIFEDTYWRFIIKYTTCYFIHQHANIGYEALTEQLLEEMGNLYVELLLETYEETRIVIEQQMQHISNELNMIEATNNNNNQLIPEENNPNMNNTLNSDETVATSTPNTTSHELEVNTNSISESLIPFLLILIHQKLLIKINKIKTKWNKIITTPIIIDKVYRNRNHINLKYIKLISISVIFISIMFISLLFHPSILENISLNYLLINITNISYYITDHLSSLYIYCWELYNIFNFTDNTTKIITPETKLINDYNENSETIDNKDITESTPFYKSKTFMILGIIIVSSTLIYLYLNNSLPFISEHNVNNTELINKLLNIITDRDGEINALRSENTQLLEQNLKVLREAAQLTHDGREFIRANNEHLLWILEN